MSVSLKRKALVLLEPDVGMDNDPCAQQRICDGVQAACSEWSDGQRDQGGRHSPVSKPVSVLRAWRIRDVYRSKTQW